MKKMMSFFLIALMLVCMTACNGKDEREGRGDLIDEGGRGDLIDEGGRGDLFDGNGEADPAGDDDENNLPYSGPDYDHPEDTDYSELVGWWYPDEDLSAPYYFSFTEDGQWYRFDRSPGEEPAEADGGSLFPDKKSDSFFYAESENTGEQYKIFLFDFNVIIMDGDEIDITLYRME